MSSNFKGHMCNGIISARNTTPKYVPKAGFLFFVLEGIEGSYREGILILYKNLLVSVQQ